MVRVTKAGTQAATLFYDTVVRATRGTQWDSVKQGARKWTRRSLLHALSKCLEPQEREVVLGDIEELHLGDRKAFASMLGLIARRQLQPWLSWRPWLAMLAVTLPAGVLLSHIANGLAASNSVYFWMYASNWTPTYLRPGWLWSELMPEIGSLLFSWFVLVCWSWTAGLVIASVSRIHNWINAGLIALVLFTAAMLHLSGGGDGLCPAADRASSSVIHKSFLQRHRSSHDGDVLCFASGNRRPCGRDSRLAGFRRSGVS